MVKYKFQVGDIIIPKDIPKYGLVIIEVLDGYYETNWCLGLTPNDSPMINKQDVIERLYRKLTKLDRALS